MKRSPHTIGIVRAGNGNYGEKLKKLGLTPVKYIKYIKDEEFSVIYDMIDKGYSDAEIADYIGNSKQTISHIRYGSTDYYRKKLKEHNRKPIKLVGNVTDDKIQYIFKAYNEGRSEQDIASDIECELSTVQRVRSGHSTYIERIKTLGFEPIRLDGTEITDDIIREIIRLAKEGKSDREISEILGVPKASVKLIRGGRVGYDKRLRALGLEPVFTKNIQPLSDDDYREIMKLAYDGVPDAEIGKRFNRSADTIGCIRSGGRNNKEILERLGIEPIKLKVRVTKR